MFFCFLLGTILIFVWFLVYLPHSKLIFCPRAKDLIFLEHPLGAECSLMVLPVMMLKKGNTQERHEIIYVTLARKYISTGKKLGCKTTG